MLYRDTFSLSSSCILSLLFLYFLGINFEFSSWHQLSFLFFLAHQTGMSQVFPFMGLYQRGKQDLRTNSL